MEIQQWREFLSPYDLAVREIKVKFKHVIDEYHNKGLYSPIERVTGRVKTIASILDKAQKKQVPMEQIEDRILDIAGVRLICQFVEDIQKVIGLIENRTDMKVINERDYISHTKDSGYRSYHMIVLYEVQTLTGPRKINVEIQIRTLAMNFWSTIEHSLQYKYQGNIPEHISTKLANVSNATIMLDNEMASVRSEILDAQNTKRARERLIEDIFDNIQNLYKVAEEEEVKRLQEEFYRVYQEKEMEKLKDFSLKVDRIAQQYRVQAVEKDQQRF